MNNNKYIIDYLYYYKNKNDETNYEKNKYGGEFDCKN